LTVCVNVPEVFVLKLLSPYNTAVNECEATERTEVTKVATPPLKLLVARAIAPSLKVTVPVGVRRPGEVAVTSP